MAKRRRERRTYKYECNLTGEKFVLTTKAEKTDDLISVQGYYEMNPEEDDRPEDIKKKSALEAQANAKAQAEAEARAAMLAAQAAEEQAKK